MQIVLEVQMQGNVTTQGILAPCFYQLLEKSYQSPIFFFLTNLLLSLLHTLPGSSGF